MIVSIQISRLWMRLLAQLVPKEALQVFSADPLPSSGSCKNDHSLKIFVLLGSKSCSFMSCNCPVSHTYLWHCSQDDIMYSADAMSSIYLHFLNCFNGQRWYHMQCWCKEANHDVSVLCKKVITIHDCKCLCHNMYSMLIQSYPRFCFHRGDVMCSADAMSSIWLHLLTCFNSQRSYHVQCWCNEPNHDVSVAKRSSRFTIVNVHVMIWILCWFNLPFVFALTEVISCAVLMRWAQFASIF